MTKAELRALANQACAETVITKVSTGQKALDLSDRDWGHLLRANKRLEGGTLVDVVHHGEEDRRSEEDRRIAERHFVMGSNGVEHCHNGLGEWIY